MQELLFVEIADIISRGVTCRDGYECGTYHKKGNTVCYSHFIKKEVLDSIVKNEIQRASGTGIERK